MILFGRMVMKCYEERGLAIWVESRFIAVLLLKAHPNFRETRAPRQTSRKMGTIEFPITLEPWPHGTWSYDGTYVDLLDVRTGQCDLMIFDWWSLLGISHWQGTPQSTGLSSVYYVPDFSMAIGEKKHDINDYNKLTPMSLEMMVSIQGNYPPMTLFLFSAILITVYIILEWP